MITRYCQRESRARAAVEATHAGAEPFSLQAMWMLHLHRHLCSLSPVKPILLSFVLVAAAASVARADASKPSSTMEKMPASARVYVLDKDAPATDKTAQMPRVRPALKQK